MDLSKSSETLQIMIITIILSISGCSSYVDKSSNLTSDKWISINGPRCEIWFQNWGDYSRLLLVLSDTINVAPSPYVTGTKEKPYLKPKPYIKVIKQQFKGNLYWDGNPSWKNGFTNNAIWIVDRANPKIKLPQEYIINAELNNGDLIMKIEKEEESFLSLRLKNINE